MVDINAYSILKAGNDQGIVFSDYSYIVMREDSAKNIPQAKLKGPHEGVLFFCLNVIVSDDKALL